MNSFNHFKLRGIFEFPLGILAYTYPHLLPISGLDHTSDGLQFVVKLLGVSMITLFILGYFAGGLPKSDPNRRSISLTLSGYHGSLASVYLTSKGVLQIPLFSFLPWELILFIYHSFFAYIFYSEYTSQTPVVSRGPDRGTNTKL